MDEALHFIRPWWLAAVIPAVALAVLWARRRRSGSHWETAVEPELLSALLEPAQGRHGRWLPWLVGAWLAIGAVGLAGPAWERLPQPVEQKNDAMIIVLDLSLSMFAEDIAPSRLVRARQKVADVLRQRDEGFTALVAYAGDAHAVVPLTDDVRTIENLLGALRPDMMPVLGSDLASALEQAHELFRNANLGRGRILVVTDAVERMNDVTRYRDARFPISVLGVGTPSGATIPLDFVNQPGQVLRTQQGNAITVALDAQRLAEIAQSGHGRYHSITLDDRDITHLLATSLPGGDETVEVEREFDTWVDVGFWACLPLLVVLLGAFRRGALAGLAALWLMPLLLVSAVAPRPAHAGVWDDLWQRRDQQARESLRHGDPERAAALFADPDWRAAALYRSGEYEAAARNFLARGDVTGFYNLGNALARQHRYADAIAAYDRALAAAPEHEDARHNRAVVEKLLQQQSGDPEADQRQQPAQDGSRDDAPPEQNPEGPTGEDAPDGTPPEDAPPEGGDPPDAAPDDQSRGEQDTLASRSEQQEALEQWLRRVPDDPGGLLRRKFQYETNQRLRRGDYRSRDAEQIW